MKRLFEKIAQMMLCWHARLGMTETHCANCYRILYVAECGEPFLCAVCLRRALLEQKERNEKITTALKSRLDIASDKLDRILMRAHRMENDWRLKEQLIDFVLSSYDKVRTELEPCDIQWISPSVQEQWNRYKNGHIRTSDYEPVILKAHKLLRASEGRDV